MMVWCRYMRFFTDRFILTLDPAEIPHGVRAVLLRETSNPDLDVEFIKMIFT